MEGQPQVHLARFSADGGKLCPAFAHHVVELRHVRMRGIGRQIRRHPVHVDPVPLQMVKDAVQILE
jgi:hypothetical protein